jgi:hypothetical protein
MFVSCSPAAASVKHEGLHCNPSDVLGKQHIFINNIKLKTGQISVGFSSIRKKQVYFCISE